MIISHKYKFIFIKTKKTAGTSIEIFLSQLCDDNDIVSPIKPHLDPHIPRNYRGLWNPISEIAETKGQSFLSSLWNVIRRKKYYSHIPAVKLKNRLPKNVWQSYYKFCVERNPWDKTLSHYHMLNDRADGNMTFNEYLKKGIFCLNLPLYTDSNNNLIVDRVIKYESLIEELTEIFSALGIPFDGDLGVRAKSNHRKDKNNYHDVYTTEQKIIIDNAFASEIKMHTYKY